MLMNMCLPKFDVYQGTLTPNYFKSYTQTLDVLHLFQKTFCLMSGLKLTLRDVTSFLRDNLFGLKKVIFRSKHGTNENR